jgi:hypothetical protein
MKYLLMLQLIFLGNPAKAESDLEAAFGLACDLISLGTFLPALEGEKQKIQFEFEKQKALMMESEVQNRKEEKIKFLREWVNEYQSLFTVQNQTLLGFRTLKSQLDFTSDTFIKLKNLMQLYQSSLTQLQGKIKDQIELRMRAARFKDIILNRSAKSKWEAYCKTNKATEACIQYKILTNPQIVPENITNQNDLNQTHVKSILVSIFEFIATVDEGIAKTSTVVEQTRFIIESYQKEIIDLGGAL